MSQKTDLSSKAGAEAIAKRLAELNPGHQYEVYLTPCDRNIRATHGAWAVREVRRAAA